MIKQPLTNTPGSEDWAQPLQRENLSDQAYAALREALTRGQLKPGERLSLRPIATRFGISPTPMREALLRLVSERALALDARGTVTVPELTLAQLMEIRAIRVDLEGNTAAAAALNATPDEVSALAALHQSIVEAQMRADWAEAISGNTRFHLALSRLGRLPLTTDIIEGLWVRCGPILSHLYDAGVPDEWHPHPHMTILQALRDRDPKTARNAIRKDIEMGGRGLLDHVAQPR